MGITVVGLGPGNGRLLTREAWEVLTSAGTVYFRTKRHPAVDDLPVSITRESFDHLYDSADTFEEVYSQIVQELLAMGADADIVYAVPGHPFVAESTVTRLVKAAKEANVSIRIVEGLSFVEPSLTALSVDALNGLQLFDAIELAAYQYPPLNADVPVLLAQVYSRRVAGELKLGLTAVYPDEHPVTLIHAAGFDQQKVEQIPLYAIDRSPHIDHLTSLYIPPLPQPSDLQALAETVGVLRAPGGCPWDQEQTSQSLRNGFLEEASEVLDAIDNDDPVNLCEELGDMLYHIVMQVQIAQEGGDFTLADVIGGIDRKLKFRHPHVWGDVDVADSDEVVKNWEELKKVEKGKLPSDSLLNGIPIALPALARSQKVQDRVRKVGFDWPSIDGVYGKLQEEILEVQEAITPAEKLDELGDVLFVAVNLASWLGVDAESALRGATQKFSRRFQKIEELLTKRGEKIEGLDIAVLEEAWQEIKRELAEEDV